MTEIGGNYARRSVRLRRDQDHRPSTLTRLAKRKAGTNVTVNAVLPGPTYRRAWRTC
jgi:hypothetical protein